MSITFDYEEWNGTKDILLNRPGSKMGYAAIQTSLLVGDTPTIRGRRRDKLIKETEEGVIGLIAGGLEWMRQRGYSAEQVENMVRVCKIKNLEQSSHAAIKNVQANVQQVSNPRSLNLSDAVVIG